jgi:protein O-mannosyl-transferase
MRIHYRPSPEHLVLFGALLTAAVYSRDLQYDFVLDDQPLILLNETFTSWKNWKLLFTSHISSSSSSAILYPGVAIHYRPIYMLWLMTISRTFALNTPWLHLTSLLLHVIAVFLVYWAGSRIVENRWAAAFAALLFAFHPVHVESVAYISASTDILVTIFFLLSLLSYLKFREDNASLLFWFLSIAAAGLAMFSKETGAMIPWILVAYEFFRGDAKFPSRDWKRYGWTLPYFAVVAAYAAVRASLFGATVWPGSGGIGSALSTIPLVLLAYLRSLVWPFQLSFFYPTDWTSHWTLARAIFFASVAAVVVWIWIRRPGRTSLRLPLVWTFIFLVPVLATVFVFISDDWVHDRHMYLASVPFCMLTAALLVESGRPPRLSGACATVVSGLLLVLTFFNVPRFRDELTLYRSALRVAPDSMTLHRFYARALLEYGQPDEALLEFQKRSHLLPDSPSAHEEYATALLRTGHDDQAAAEFNKVLQYAPVRTPFRAFALYRLATIELKQGKTSQATDHLREALQIDSQQLNYHATLAQALRAQGLDQEAREEDQREAALRSVAVRKQSPADRTKTQQ